MKRNICRRQKIRYNTTCRVSSLTRRGYEIREVRIAIINPVRTDVVKICACTSETVTLTTLY